MTEDDKLCDDFWNSEIAEKETKSSESELSDLLCVGNDFKRNFLGDFKPDKRYIALIDRLQKYYADTPDSMNNKTALPYWKEFNRWCSDRGYTREEVNYAKLNIPA